MPGSPEELEAQLSDQEAQTAQAREGGLAQMIPPAEEPLEESNLNALGATLAQAVPVLSGGQVPDVGIPEYAGAMEQVPIELAKALLAVAAFLQTQKVPGTEQYAFDPIAAMRSNAGLQDATHKIAALQEDGNVLGKLSGPPGRGEPGEPLPEPPNEDLPEDGVM